MSVASQVDPLLFTFRPPLLSVRSRPGGGAAVLVLLGKLAQDTGGVLDRGVAGALGAAAVAGELVLDVSGLGFCDSGGLNAVVRAHSRARAVGAVLHIVSSAPQVAALLRRTGVTQVLRVSPAPAASPAVEPARP